MVYVYVFGGKWFDKVNGNTYHNAKIAYNGKVYYSGFSYGYGDSYLESAKNFIEKNFPQLNYDIVDLGSGYYKKSYLKKNWF